MIKNTILYTPKDGLSLIEQMTSDTEYKTVYEVVNDTTLSACKKIIENGAAEVIALNFASAKNPGGGFLKGSNAQEESLARSSGLYASVSVQRVMYDENKRSKSGMYTDYMIYSPNVPVIRDESGRLIEPYNVSFVTAPAVNTGIVRSRERHITQSHIDSVMKKRIERILAVALYNGHKHIVLGAFGCGVFRNSPRSVARYFDEILNRNLRFKNKFKKVVFAVLDSSDEKRIISPFEENFKQD